MIQVLMLIAIIFVGYLILKDQRNIFGGSGAGGFGGGSGGSNNLPNFSNPQQLYRVNVPGTSIPLNAGALSGGSYDKGSVESQLKGIGFSEKDMDEFYEWLEKGGQKTGAEIFNWLSERANDKGLYGSTGQSMFRV